MNGKEDEGREAKEGNGGERWEGVTVREGKSGNKERDIGSPTF